MHPISYVSRQGARKNTNKNMTKKEGILKDYRVPFKSTRGNIMTNNVDSLERLDMSKRIVQNTGLVLKGK
ncbi:hypothetical protein Lal_00034039, partial [Lupinus albus]